MDPKIVVESIMIEYPLTQLSNQDDDTTAGSKSFLDEEDNNDVDNDEDEGVKDVDKDDDNNDDNDEDEDNDDNVGVVDEEDDNYLGVQDVNDDDDVEDNDAGDFLMSEGSQDFITQDFNLKEDTTTHTSTDLDDTMDVDQDIYEDFISTVFDLKQENVEDQDEFNYILDVLKKYDKYMSKLE